MINFCQKEREDIKRDMWREKGERKKEETKRRYSKGTKGKQMLHDYQFCQSFIEPADINCIVVSLLIFLTGFLRQLKFEFLKDLDYAFCEYYPEN